MNKISIRVLIVGLLIFCFKSFAQTPVEIHQGGSVVSTSNPFYVTFSGDIEIDTAILQDILEQLEKNTYTGDYLNVRFNNTTIGATQSGTWNIGSITTLPSVTIASMPSTPVTGTFFQETQPVSIASMPSTPVTGTFWQETQPVSGTVTANAGTGTMAVSIASMPSTPVTGTFYQETQPVSLADNVISESTIILTLTSADTEYSYTLPATATYFFARESTGAITIRYSSYSGGTADGGAYQELYAKEGKESPNRTGDKLGAKTLYFRDKSNAGTKVIIEFWTR